MKDVCLLNFSKPGMHTLVQDSGRQGFQKFGVPVSGAMDQKSAFLANWLVGNSPASPTLELTFGGPTFSVQGDCQMAITGADLSPTINGQPFPQYKTVDVIDGSVIAFGKNKRGCRAYIGIGGDWKVRSWLESVSATPFNPEQITPDSVIRKGSYLKIKKGTKIKLRSYQIEEKEIPRGDHRVSVLPGPEFNLFDPLSVGIFFSKTYRISHHSNRMGYRLEGSLPGFNPSKELISSGCLPGTIQVTNSGQPIILMADAQSTGGYYRLGHVIRTDIDYLAQARPGESVSFRLIELEEAQAILRNYLVWEKELEMQ